VPPSRSSVAILAVVIVVLSSGACTNAETPAVTVSGDHDGLALDLRMHATPDSIVVETTVRNTRAAAVHLDADQCGRVTEVVLARTVFEPEGATYTGSLDAVKRYVLQQQRSYQQPDRFAPRRVTGGSDVPDCVRPATPITIDAGGSIHERWELPVTMAFGLAVAGSANEMVRAEAVESTAADKLGFLDVYPTGEAEDVRAGRAVIAESPASGVLDRTPTRPSLDPSLGQRFDRMIETAAVRDFIEGQPADSWRQATITPTLAGALDFRAVTTRYERALRASLANDGAVVGQADLPGPGDTAKLLERRPATLPPGIALIPEPEAPVPTEDVIAGLLSLPTGRVVADGALVGDAEPLPDRAEPGAYPVSVTVGRLPGNSFDQVAFASLVVSDATTVSWAARSTIAVDGGTAGFTSAEGSERLRRLAESTGIDAIESAFDSLTAHDDLISKVSIGEGLDLAIFSSGYGDGGYGVYVGLDADGRPTRFVIDFAIVHLDWPVP
jgi:hypothetical protein